MELEKKIEREMYEHDSNDFDTMAEAIQLAMEAACEKMGLDFEQYQWSLKIEKA